MSLEDHHLAPFLQEELPKLGLDFDTYGPYILTDDLLLSSGNDQEEWEAVMELLQASSETHSDDTDVWDTFQTQLRQRQRAHQREQDAQQHQLRTAQVQEQERALQEEIQLAQTHPVENKTKQRELLSKLDAQKRALVDRYAYDESEMYDDNGNLVVVGGSVGDASHLPNNKSNNSSNNSSNHNEPSLVTNKQAAQQAHQEQARQLRQQSNTSKKAEREATARAKVEKARIKEERRKRATKGERKR